ncbi:tubulin-like doman-containing protein [Kitasatospora azatica]|uniref:tubulin-like doman-containing protein n=1 Tax=Kitasatospora azatica TaxID=58347 RepID=UPI0005643E57|nr:tubulin-like doman-containing protein [Kitasatospora azatica]
MKIFQPMLFVGLGGTGGLVGAELERRLRAELCGPDGTALGQLGGLLPYQLPDCLQFVYADFSESDLARLPQFNVDPALRAAYSRTSRATHDLLPNFDSSPEVTQMLRARLREEVSSWLPPRDGEPRVTPLRHGAGQLPTVGRAGLFGTLRNGLDPVLEPLMQAIDAIARSAGVLSQLGGGPLSGCDVFVAFSVAGGTGAGIFLDYLYLINHAFREKRLDGVKIYPLVVMPSAFPASGGGGREAELNSARALVDLFRLVDEQNAPTAGAELGDLDEDPALRIRYPRVSPVRLRTGILPTAFLFSRTAGIRQDDLRRSMVSLVMSLIGTELGDGRQGARGRADDDYQTFAASFINRGVQRAAAAASGIGRQGVSTSLVASMTAPMDELASLVSGRILRASVDQLGNRTRHSAQPLDELVKAMFVDSGLEELLERMPLPIGDPDPLPRGSTAIEAALAARLGDMQTQLSDLRYRTALRAAELAGSFNPRRAIERLLQNGDPFLLERVVHGNLEDGGPLGRLGFLGLLDNRARIPALPTGTREQPPSAPRVRRRLAGLAKARWGDDEVQAVVRAQDAWYKWRSRVIWHEAWKDQQQRWEPTAKAASAEVTRLVSAFRRHADQERKAFGDQSRELYSDRTGVSYLLPPQRDLRHFYEDLTTRLISREGLRETDNEAELVLRMVDGASWQKANTLSRRNPDGAVGEVRAVLESGVKRLFAESGGQLEERPLLPSMGVLLSAAAGNAEAEEQVSKEARELFARKLAGLLPAGFTPEGTGPLKALIVYPRVQNTEEVESFLRKELRLPNDSQLTVEFRGVETESITVVLFRSEMSLTQVPEARRVLRQWAKAKEAEQTEDVLRWRQRLGYRDDWLVSTEADRRVILHRLLCALWNGQLDVLEGSDQSPERIRIRLFAEQGPDVPGVRLRLGDYPDGISTWAELLRVYERWTVLDDEQTVEDYCRRLMSTQPVGLARSGSRPHPLFVKLVEEVAPEQLRMLQERRRRDGDRIEGWVRPLWQFWAETLPAALDIPFADRRAAQPTLRTLLAAISTGELLPRGAEEPAEPPAARPAAAREDDWGTSRLGESRSEPDEWDEPLRKEPRQPRESRNPVAERSYPDWLDDDPEPDRGIRDEHDRRDRDHHDDRDRDRNDSNDHDDWDGDPQ